MADPRDVEYEEEETPVHVQIRASIFLNSSGTLNVALERFPSIEEAVNYLNTEPLDGYGNRAYHLAAGDGKYAIIDEFLDFEGFECDPLNNNGDTPLHSAVHWTNQDRGNWSAGLTLVQMMLEAGSDNKVRNKQGHSAADLAGLNFELKQLIEDYTFPDEDENGDPAPGSEKVESGYLDIDEADDGKDDENSVYSGSDSEEEEEWKKRREEKAKKAAS